MAGEIRDELKRTLGKRLKFEKIKIQSELPTESDYYLFRRYLYKGGVCGSNVKYAGMKIHGCGCADLESDYPAQIMHRKFPAGRVTRCENSEFMTDKNIPYIARIRCIGVKSTTEHAIISSYKCMNEPDLNSTNSIIDNGRIYRADVIEIVVNDVEWNDLQRAYTIEDFEIVTCWKFERYQYAPKHLQDITAKYYGLKTRLKRDGKNDTIEYTIAKRRANSIYGMCATSIFPVEKKINKNGEIVDFPDAPPLRRFRNMRRTGTGTPRSWLRTVEIVLNTFWRKSYRQAVKSMFLSPFIAMWVSAYARGILIDFITRFPDAILQYDTDSLYYRLSSDQTAGLIAAMNEYNERIHQINARLFCGDDLYSNLGTWDMDNNIKIFKGLGAKRYIYAYKNKNGKDKIKQVIAGCRKGTLCKQIRDINRRTRSHTDAFAFMSNNMYIDPAHSGKLSSAYVDDPHMLMYEFDNGDGTGTHEEIIACPSALVLNETDFTMRLMPYYINHMNRMQAERREVLNCGKNHIYK